MTKLLYTFSLFKNINRFDFSKVIAFVYVIHANSIYLAYNLERKENGLLSVVTQSIIKIILVEIVDINYG